jgi:membrane protease YdiL (CAAX protease family)
MSEYESPTLEPAPAPMASGKPWGFWATLGFSLLILLAWLVAQVVATFVYFVVTPSGRALFKQVMSGHSAPSSLTEDGTLLAIAGTLSGILLPPVCVLFAWLRRGISPKEYLGLRNVPLAPWIRWLGICLLFCAGSDSVTWLLGRPIVPKFMENAYRSVIFEPLLWFAVIVGAPLFEEFLFRGFALAGFRYSRLGIIGAVGLTSLGWTALHTQYDLIDLSDLFLMGLLLGYARIRTGSLFIPIAMHALNNLWATLEVAIKVHFLS